MTMADEKRYFSVKDMQAFRELFSNVDKKSTKGTVNLMAANFALLIAHMMKSSTVSPMTKKMTRMNRRQMEHDGPRV